MAKVTKILYYEPETNFKRPSYPLVTEDIAILINGKCVFLDHYDNDDCYGERMQSKADQYLWTLVDLGLFENKDIKEKRVVKKNSCRIEKKIHKVKDVLHKELYSTGLIPPCFDVGEKMNINGDSVIVSVSLIDLRNGINDSHREMANRALEAIREWSLIRTNDKERKKFIDDCLDLIEDIKRNK